MRIIPGSGGEGGDMCGVWGRLENSGEKVLCV